MKRIINIILSIFLISQTIMPAFAKGAKTPSLSCKYYAIYDIDTDQFVYADNIDVQVYPASTTKVMLALIALESNIPLSTPFTLDQTWFEEMDEEASRLWFSTGDVLTLEDLLYCASVYSANDAAIAIARLVASSEEECLKRMNERAKELGCTNTHFVTVNGLDGDDQYTTVADMCMIMKEAIQYPAFNKIFSAMDFYVPWTASRGEGFEIINWSNENIDPETDYYIEGIVSSKTGFTDKARACELSYVSYEDKNFIVATYKGDGDHYRSADQYNLAYFFMDNFKVYDIPQDYKKPKFDVPFFYSVSGDYYDIDPKKQIYAQKNYNSDKVKRTFEAIELTPDAKAGDLAGYYVYTQNDLTLHKQAVYVSNDALIQISLWKIAMVVGAVLFVLLIIVAIALRIRAIARKRRMRRRKRRGTRR